MVRWFLRVLLWMTIPLASAQAEAPRKRSAPFETPLSALVGPAKVKDRADLSRVAMRIGPARLVQALSDTNPEIRHAALQAIPLIPQAPLLLQYISPLANAGAVPQRELALHALAEILPGLDGDRTLEWEVPREITAEACTTLLATGKDATMASPARVLAVSTLGSSVATCGAMDLSPLLADKEPAVRRAAVLALGGPADRVTAALHTALSDPAPTVSAAAGARFCREKRPGPPPSDLWRRMAVAKDASPDDLVEIIPCLDPSAAEDKAALSALRSHPAPAVREAAQATAKIPTKSNGI